MASDRRRLRIERLLDEAEDAVARYDWQAVREAAQAVLAFDPDNSDAIDLLTGVERALSVSAPTSPVPPPTSVASLAPSPTSDQPRSFANGRYQVKRFLGEGGKKRVYQAHDSALDRDVAIAVIKAEGLDDVARTRITREAPAMGRLGDHPNILQIHDLGEEPSTGSVQAHDQTYLILPLMTGGSVDGLIEKVPHDRIELEQALDIAKGVCRGLEFAHGRGIVHRDLKPGNVWLADDGTAKIGDFGLAVVLDRSRITGEGMMVGTVSYMPPEQAMGGEVTPKSDLYSLGAMLYEMVTSRPPFMGDDAVAIIGQHINTPPVAPTWHNGQCPRALDALILRLLAKDPSERPQSAADVLAALDAIDLTKGPPLERGDGGISDPHALDSLAGGVFVGRQQEMGELKASLEDALSGRGRLVMLVGEPGIGKTRTAQELATYAGMRGAQVLWGRCYEEQGMPPYWPWVQAIRAYVREADAERLRSAMGAGAPDIAEVVSDVKERLPDLQPPPELEPEQARFRLFDSIATFLKSAGQEQPQVLMLDDLHWADKPSLLLLEFLARELSGARLLIIGTYRDMELSRQHPLAESLGGLNRERLFQRVLLRGLTQQDVHRFIEIAAGMAPPPGLVGAVHTQTEGNPLFVTEVVRLLVQEGELSADQAGTRESWTVRIPEGVREVIGRRLNRLSQRCNETLTIASVIGREFELRQLAPLAEGISDDQLLEVLEEALGARVIEELPQSAGRYQFTHALIQETLSQELSTTRRVRLHARIAEMLEEMYGDDAESHAAELAHHLAQAETVVGTEKLVRYSLLAGERALGNYAHEEALTHFERGLVARNITLSGTEAASDEEAAALLFGLARAQTATVEGHQLLEVFATLSRAFEHYAKAGNVSQVVAAAEFPINSPVYRIPGVPELIARALALVPADSHEAGRLLSRYGGVVGASDHDSGQEALQRAIDIARRKGDVALEVRTLTYAALVSGAHLHWQESADYGLRAIERSAAGENPFSDLISRFWTAASHLAMGDLEGARPHVMVMRDLAQRRSTPRLLASNHLMMVMTLSCLEGDWKVAREHCDRGLEITPLQPQLLGTRVLLEYETGEFDEGEIYLERLLRRADPRASARVCIAFAIIARITGSPDGLDIASAIAEEVLSDQSVNLNVGISAQTGLALMYVQKGDQSKVKEHYAYFLGHRGTMIWSHRSTGFLGSYPRPWVNWTSLPNTLRKPWPSAARPATGPSWPGAAATTRTC